VLIQFFESNVGDAKSISKSAKEPCFLRILLVEDYRYGVVLGVNFG
jgi:hypothetical protein